MQRGTKKLRSRGSTSVVCYLGRRAGFPALAAFLTILRHSFACGFVVSSRSLTPVASSGAKGTILRATYTREECSSAIDGYDRAILGDRFIQRVLELQEYKEVHGDCLVPKRYTANPTLGNFVNRTRQNYRKYLNGKGGALNEERVAVLNNLGFVWDASNTRKTAKASHDQAWKTKYDELARYKAEHGTCRVPSITGLGRWVVRQRFQYNRLRSGEESSLTPDRIALLESLGFQWSSRSEDLWKRRVDELVQFKKEHGHCLVPNKYDKNPQLGAWVATQRRNHKRRKQGRTTNLTKQREKQLEGLGFVWSYWDHLIPM